MGRPLKKDQNGVDVINTPLLTATGITVRFHDGTSLHSDGIIIKQIGGKRYRIARIGTPTVTTACTLVSGTPAAEGEVSIRGYNSGGSGQGAQVTANLVSIAKLTKRVATDYSGNRYTWFLENDSSADYIVLTAL
jgi:hypothetical protein